MKGLRGLLAAGVLALAACNADDIPRERLPRFEPPPAGWQPKVALVLGSGGPRGFAHIGVLKVLEENGIRADLIIGSSVGAMVGALYAHGIGAAELEKMAYTLNIMEFFEFRQITGGLSTGRGVQSYVNTLVKGQPLEALRTPFVPIAMRVSDRQLVAFNRGDTGLAVRASSASPGQFQPVRIGADEFIDGDEASPVPIHTARALGARVVIAVDVSAYAEDTPSGVPQEWVEKDARRARQVKAEAPEADVMLHPNIGYYAGHTEDYRRGVIATAERYTREKMPAIRAAMQRAGVALATQSSTARIPAGDASR